VVGLAALDPPYEQTINGDDRMARKRKTKPATAAVPIDAIKHKDARTNIPTRELAAFAGDDERTPKTVCYPRDPSLDPQLVWKGKDEQDNKPLEVPAVPIYIQEKIHPQALIEDIRERAAAGKSRQLDLFADFNGIDEFEKKVDFYHHDQHWSNRMILGDSLLVMTSLAEKERLKGRVQMIYVDPPYGIKFGSNWQVSTRKRDVKDAKAEDATRQPEQIKAFRDTWQLGIHSYLTYLRDRLVVARDLLTETGSIFAQIGDENVHLVRCLMDEVFGSENCVSLITFKKTTGQTSGYLAGTSDYIVWYAKNLDVLKYRALYRERELGDEGADAYTAVELAEGTRRRLAPEEIANPRLLPAKARPYRLQILQSQRQGRPSGPGSAMYFGVEFQGREYFPEGNRGWTTTQKGMRQLGYAGRFAVQGGSLSYVRYLNDFPAMPLNNLWNETQSGSSMDKVYVVQTNVEVVKRCLLMTTDPGDLVLDPTCGSGTTAYVAEQWGRRWITLDTSRVALALARTRLMAAKFPYYLLADSPEGRKLSGEGCGGSRSSTHPTPDATDECSPSDASEGRRVGRAQRDPPTAGQGCGGSRSSTHPTTDAPDESTTNAGSPDIRRGFVY
jgi:adenine-specific DNA-methyltransferase